MNLVLCLPIYPHLPMNSLEAMGVWLGKQCVYCKGEEF